MPRTTSQRTRIKHEERGKITNALIGTLVVGILLMVFAIIIVTVPGSLQWLIFIAMMAAGALMTVYAVTILAKRSVK